MYVMFFWYNANFANTSASFLPCRTEARIIYDGDG